MHGMRPTVVHFTDASEFGGAERMIVTLMAEIRLAVAEKRNQGAPHRPESQLSMWKDFLARNHLWLFH